LSTHQSKEFDNGTAYGVGFYRQLDSFILENEYRVLEGLIVDAKIGGIGLRNHTVPTGLDHGATWSEDLLFFEPDAGCVNTNITFDYEVDYNSEDFTGLRNLVITDRGGFAELNETYPTYDHPGAQSNPDLMGRAYKAAYLNNFYTMLVYNITNPNNNRTQQRAFSYLNSEVGKTFPLNASTSDQYRALSVSSQFGNYLDPLDGLLGFPNPFNVTKDDFDAVSVICAGAGSADFSNITNIYVGCGLIQGAPIRTDGGSPSLFENGSKWTSSLHACAATIQATIKTVTFEYNATSHSNKFSGLSVKSIEPKEYASEDEWPLWGLESYGTEFTLGGIDAIWGLISPEYESHENVSSIRQQFFHPPGTSAGFAAGLYNNAAVGSNLPASNFAKMAMDQVFALGGGSWPFDLRGLSSMAIFTRWQSLSPNTTEAANILKLMWTDIAASAVVGTKGALGYLNNGGKDEAVAINIRPIGRQITYKLLYGIPAFLLLLCIATIWLIMLIAMCFGKASIDRLRRRMYQLSPGRIYTTYLFPQFSSLTMLSKEWREKNGAHLVKLTNVGENGEAVGLVSQGYLPPTSPPIQQLEYTAYGSKPGYP
jgi:hypothetical protein